MVHQRDGAFLLAVAFHHKLHRKLRHAVLFQVDRRGSSHRAIHRKVDGQAFHLIIALVNHAHHQVVGQARLNDGRCQPHRIDVQVGLELGHHRDDNHLHRRVSLGCRQIKSVFLKVRINKQGRCFKSMLMTEHLEAVHYLTHGHRCSIRIHTVKLVEHLFLVHRVFVLNLEAVGHQQVTA